MFDAAPDESGSSRAFIGAAALAVGILTGFAGGYITGQRNGIAASSSPMAPIEDAAGPPPAAADVPAESYTEMPVAELPAPAAMPAATVEVATPPAPRGSTTRPASLGGAGQLFVLSRPAGAQVLLDEQPVGTTPLSLSDVPAGTYRVRLDLPGHQRWVTAVTVTGGESARVAASLEQ